MKKTEIYVPIANKKEAKQAKAVLKAMGEEIYPIFWHDDYDANQDKLIFRDYDKWVIIGGNEENKTKITLKQLIEFLVSEGNEKAKPVSEPKKIAIRVENEREQVSVERFYGGKYNTAVTFPCFIYDRKFIDHLRWSRQEELAKHDNDVVISFQDFTKENNAELPLLKSEDGVWLFKGNSYWLVELGIRNRLLEDEGFIHSSHAIFNKPKDFKAFSTKQSALDWIEAQKPKEVEFILSGCTNKVVVNKSDVTIELLSGKLQLSKTDVERMSKAMEELNNG